MKNKVREIVSAAAIAALYAGLTIFLAPISYGPIQFRVAEVLCILPFFFPYAVPGLFVGCLIANLISSYGVIDVVCGSIATLLAAWSTMMIGKHTGRGKVAAALACLPPVLFNGLIVGGAIAAVTGDTAFWRAFLIFGSEIAVSELAVMYVIAFPLCLVFPKTSIYKSLMSNSD